MTCGESAVATVTLNFPSLLGDVAADALSGAIGFATVTPPWVIPQGSISANFIVTTPDYLIAFPTKHASIYVGYGDSSATPMLNVKSKVVAGILDSLRIFPTEISAGEPSTGTVAGCPWIPSSAWRRSSRVPIRPAFPSLAGGSSVASVPSSVTIKAGDISQTFAISASDSVAPHTKRKVTIMAGAVQYKSATLTVDG